MDTTETNDLPYRVVTEEWQGYVHVRGTTYWTDRVDGAYVDWKELTAQHTVRPVLPITDQDRDELTRILDAAGAKAIGTVLAAMFRASLELAEPGVLPKLRAGRSGSWEAEAFNSIAWNVGADLERKPHRIDAAGTEAIAAMLKRWVSDPGRYTEVAETLSWVVSAHADAAGGWAKIADRYMQPTAKVGMNPATMESVANYLLHFAECRDTAVEAFDALL